MSSDNVSEGARRDEEAEAKESPKERSLVENTFTRNSVINENDRRIYEVDEKPEGRPRRRIKTLGKYSDFVMNSAKNRQIKVTSKSEVTRSLSEVMPPNGRVIPRMLRRTSELTARKEGPERSGDSKEEDEGGQKETKRVRHTALSASGNSDRSSTCFVIWLSCIKRMRPRRILTKRKRGASPHTTSWELGAERVTKRKKPKTPAVVHHLTSSSSSSERPCPPSQVPPSLAQGRPPSPPLTQVQKKRLRAIE